MGTNSRILISMSIITTYLVFFSGVIFSSLLLALFFNVNESLNVILILSFSYIMVYIVFIESLRKYWIIEYIQLINTLKMNREVIILDLASLTYSMLLAYALYTLNIPLIITALTLIHVIITIKISKLIKHAQQSTGN